MTLLIYPRSKPYGANSTNSRSAISESAAYPTEVIDYLKFNILDPIDDTIEHTLYLYLPSKLSETYTAKYNGVELGAVGNAAVNAAKGAIDAGGIGDSFAANVKQFASAAKPALGFKLGASAINTVVGEVSPYGFNVDSNDLAQLTKGKVFNPYEEMLFKGVGFISHSFKFTFVPKSAADVQTIYEIISCLRQSMHPSKKGNDWLTIPDKFDAEIVRYESKGGDEKLGGGKAAGGYMNALLRFPYKMVLQDMSVDFGDSTAIRTQMPGAASNADFGFAVYNMTISFQETKYRTREDFKDD